MRLATLTAPCCLRATSAKHACDSPLNVLASARTANSWSEIAQTWRALAGDSQWRVRRTLAFSIHEIAGLLGPEDAESELTSTFDRFLRDLDEVRPAAFCSVSLYRPIPPC